MSFPPVSPGPQQPHQQPGYGPPPPGFGPPPRRKSKAPWIIGGLVAGVLVCCGGAAIVGAVGDNPGTTASTDSATTGGQDPPAGGNDKPAALPGLGDPARDGKFEFVVKSVKCGKTKVGPELFEETAQGVFCEVKVTVKNIGDEPQTFDGGAQKAYDSKGGEYSNDSAAEIMAGGDRTFFEQINPGNTVAGTLLYDVPRGTKLTRIELHDSAFSGGVEVALR